MLKMNKTTKNWNKIKQKNKMKSRSKLKMKMLEELLSSKKMTTLRMKIKSRSKTVKLREHRDQKENIDQNLIMKIEGRTKEEEEGAEEEVEEEEVEEVVTIREKMEMKKVSLKFKREVMLKEVEEVKEGEEVTEATEIITEATEEAKKEGKEEDLKERIAEEEIQSKSRMSQPKKPLLSEQ